MACDCAIGLDIGGTKTAVGLVDARGVLLADVEFATAPAEGLDAAVARVAAAVETLIATGPGTRSALRGVGAGCSGPVDPFTGTVNNDFTLPSWGGRNLVETLGAALRLPVWLENDADAALLGEAWTGAASGLTHAAMLTFGTGVGAAVLADGQLLRGAGGNHPELPHLVIDPSGPPCYCGARGCLESLVSGPALARQAARLGLAGARELFAAAAQGRPAACEVIAAAVDATSRAVWAFAHAYLPEKIIFGGGVMEEHFTAWFEAPLARRLAGMTLYPDHPVSVAAAVLGNRAGVIGAAALVLGGRGVRRGE